jgi:hypothetical protein
VYSDEQRIAAKRLWLEGVKKTDLEIAEAVGVTRPDTIRDWRTKENWPADKDMFDSLVAQRVKNLRVSRRQEANDRQAKIAEAFQHLIGRAMRDPAIRPGGIKALASAADTAQRMQRLALAMDGPPDPISEGGGNRTFSWVLGHRPEEAEILRKYREGRLVESAPEPAPPKPQAAPPSKPGPAPWVPPTNPPKAGPTPPPSAPAPPTSTPRTPP